MIGWLVIQTLSLLSPLSLNSPIHHPSIYLGAGMQKSLPNVVTTTPFLGKPLLLAFEEFFKSLSQLGIDGVGLVTDNLKENFSDVDLQF